MTLSAIRPSAVKRELAQRILRDAEAPGQAVKALFDGIMQQLEVVAKTNFEAGMKTRIWQATSGQRLQTAEDTLISEFCTRVLGIFSEEEAAAALAEHKTPGGVRTPLYELGIRAGHALYSHSITSSVATKAKSMAEDWAIEIIHLVREEGVALPELASE